MPDERAERHAVAGEAGADELMRCRLADIGQSVGRLDHLSRPAVRHLDVRDEHRVSVRSSRS